MLLENKFLFLGKIFCVIFLIINAVNFFPLSLGEASYYTRIFNTILDTSTLLILGFSIPKFLFTRKILSLRNLKLSRNEEETDISIEIEKLEGKEFNHSKITKYISLLFLIIALAQPVNLVFLLNKSDFLVTQAIDSLNNSLDIQKIKINELKENSKINLSEELAIKRDAESKEFLLNLENNFNERIDSVISTNNLNKFNQSKFIIRNILMSLVWSFAFFKLSKINSIE